MTNEKLVLDYIPLANSIAWKKSQKTPKNVTLEDLKSVAYMALVKAASKFNPNLGVFSTYAKIRIVGEIKDYLRSLVRDVKIKSMDNLECLLEHKESNCLVTKDYFNFIFSKLNKIEATILKMYYIEEKKMKDIGVILKISESRVSQILKSCYYKLKSFEGLV